MMPPSSDNSPEDPSGAAAPGGRVVAGRYRTERPLKHGPLQQTFLGTDLRDGKPVVIRIVSSASVAPTSLPRLFDEAPVLSQLRNDWLAPIDHFGCEDDGLVWVRPFVAGAPLAERLKRGPLTLPEAMAVGRCLFSALKEIHGRDLLHRNVKPGNLIVWTDREKEPEFLGAPSPGRLPHGAREDGEVSCPPFLNEGESIVGAALTDCGLAGNGLSDSGELERAAETALYLSPEQAGSLDLGVGEPADLYSAGVVLFECLAGHPPFSGDTVGAVLLNHMTAQPPELRRRGLKVPRVLDEVIQRLLRKDPRDRYQTADGVLADLALIERAVAAGDPEPDFVVGGSDRRSTLTEPAFVARSRELAMLDEHIERARRGEGDLVVLEAESGGGKSRMLDELTQRGARAGMWVLRGQGSDQVGQRPFHLLRDIVEEIVSAAKRDPEWFSQVRSQIGEQQEAVRSALPEMAEAIGWQAANLLLPESFGETRSVQALSQFLDALGSAARPALIVMDDCQWADELAVKLLANWIERRPTDGAGRHVFLVAAFRSEEVPAEHPLRNLRAAGRLELSRFDPADVKRLVESMAGPLPEEVVELIAKLSEGSPFMASAVLRGLVESGAMVASPQGWQVEPLGLSELRSSRQAAALLARRIDLLPPETVALLTVGAVLGKEFHLETAARLCERLVPQAVSDLDLARRRHIVWIRPDAARCAFVHDRLRSVLLDRLTAEQRRDLHLRAALHLRDASDGTAFDLAYHFDAAGKSELALDYALEAAAQARRQNSLEIAEQQYRIAHRGAAQVATAIKYRIAEGLGDVLMLRGRYDAAARRFEAAATLAEGELARAEIKGKLGELALKRGDMESATASFEEALRLLGRRVPRSLPECAVLLAWEALVQVCHSLLPAVFVASRNRAPKPEERLAWRLFSRLAHGYWFVRSKVHVLWTHLRGMNLAERYAPTLELAQSYSEHAPAMSLISLFGRGVAYAEKSLAIRTHFGDVWGQGQSLHYHAVVLYAASRFAECFQKATEAVRLLERTGDYWEVHIARYQAAASLYRLGDLSAAVEHARRNYASGIKLGDEQASGISLDVWARASVAPPPEDVFAAEMARPRNDAQGAAQVMLGEGVRLLKAEQVDDAAATFEKAVLVARQAGVHNTYVTPNAAWLATARRLQAEHYTGYTPAERWRRWRRAAAAARRAVRFSRRFQNDLPHALRERALVAGACGWARRARRLFDKSLAVAQRQGARYEHAQSLWHRGRVGRELGWAEAEAQFAAAENELRALEASARPSGPAPAAPAGELVSLSLVDRFGTVLEAGRRIAGALSCETIFQEAHRAALRLLRGEQCLIARLSEDDEQSTGVTVAGDANATPDRWQVERALRMGRAVSATESAAGEFGAGDGAGGSCLCAPIFVRGQAAAYVYVTHRRVRGLFGPDEERLADFITTLAGAALENADGFQQLQGLNETLEQRVAERTAAAEAASKAKSEFLAMVSHEIRTPMNGIQGMTELALATPLTMQQKGYLNIVRQSSDSLLGLLNDILDFSKIEAGRMELERIPFDVREVVGDALQVRARCASEKGLKLIHHVHADTPRTLLGDPGRLRQVIVNLVGNSVKFTTEGEIVVEVRVEQRAGDAVRLHASVRDTGVGIAKDKHACIFESFRQADSSTTRRYGGTGLGLSISSQLVALMGGRIWVESEPGLGSTFHFTADMGLPEEAAEWPARPAALQGVRVLIADDHPASRTALYESLNGCGLRAATAAGTSEAHAELLRAAADGDPYRLLIADAELPPSNGASLADLVGRDDALRACRSILLLPASERAQSICQADAGTAHFLTKPAKYSELIEAATSAIGAPDDAAPGSGPRATGEQLSGLRVLLVEDGVVNRDVAVGLLELRGHRVEEAENGFEALDALKKHTFDAVLMDLEMPGMDGLEATAEIRRLEAGGERRVPIVAMTAHAVKGFRDRCLEAGMDAYITKPISPKELYETLESVVEASLSLAASR